MDKIYDLVIIGGGINGCGCAADAALRGLSVLLCEKDDLSSKTSSSSSKLIHGGLRYLEQYNFSLVKKALRERQLLLELAPHLVYPLQLCLPQKNKLRPAWIIRTALFIYDNLSRHNRLPRSKFISRANHINIFTPLIKTANKGFLFYDCATDDARLTITNAIQAKLGGAQIMPRTEIVRAAVNNKLWDLTLKTGQENTIRIKARSIINAAGPWVNQVNRLLNVPCSRQISLVKGSHIVLPKLYDGNHAYMLQNTDKRIVFVIPYNNQTMVGTTEILISDLSSAPCITDEEKNYLCELVNDYFNKKVCANDIINSWSGIRPLISAPSKSYSSLNRDYITDYQELPAPIISIYGGKITTYRQLAEQTINKLQAVFPNIKKSKTTTTPLPGAQLGLMNYVEYEFRAKQEFDWLDSSILDRYLKTYGTRTQLLLNNCKKMDDLGEHFGNYLYQREVDFLIKEEWAMSTEDILWRRTKLGLDFNVNNYAQLTKYIHTQLSCLT